MATKNIILIVLITVIIVLAGVLSSGILSQKGVSSVGKSEKETIAKLANSEVVTSFTAVALGKVTKVSGRVITLTKGGDNLDILIREGAPVYSTVVVPGGSGPKEFGFSDIKVGSNLSISIKVLQDGTVEGEIVAEYLPVE